jgi:hypothetical protein
MVAKKPLNRRPVKKIEEQSNKNLMGLGGFAMIMLTNYQTEIKQSLSILFGFIK